MLTLLYGCSVQIALLFLSILAVGLVLVETELFKAGARNGPRSSSPVHLPPFRPHAAAAAVVLAHICRGTGLLGLVGGAGRRARGMSCNYTPSRCHVNDARSRGWSRPSSTGPPASWRFLPRRSCVCADPFSNACIKLVAPGCAVHVHVFGRCLMRLSRAATFSSTRVEDAL